jgi:trehalose 6-phosphate phosphatase
LRGVSFAEKLRQVGVSMRLDPASVHLLADRTALALDYDGTLSPIVEDPSCAVPLPGMAELLARLIPHFRAIALVSGRPAAELLGRLSVSGLRYLGLYGLEEVVDGTVIIDEEAQRLEPEVRAAIAELSHHPAVLAAQAYVEDKGRATAIHLRRVKDPPKWMDTIEEAARDVAARHGLRVLSGRLVWELRPAGQGDKGYALRRLVAESNAQAVVVVGDDLGDIPAFDAAQELRNRGMGCLRVAVLSAESPRELLERADYVVDGPEGVRKLLESFVQEDDGFAHGSIPSRDLATPASGEPSS